MVIQLHWDEVELWNHKMIQAWLWIMSLPYWRMISHFKFSEPLSSAIEMIIKCQLLKWCVYNSWQIVSIQWILPMVITIFPYKNNFKPLHFSKLKTKLYKKNDCIPRMDSQFCLLLSFNYEINHFVFHWVFTLILILNVSYYAVVFYFYLLIFQSQCFTNIWFYMLSV